MAKNKLTPAMEQYMHFKRLHQDAILFFRMGDFYEMFFDDAKDAARLLGLTLTSRNHGKTSGRRAACRRATSRNGKLSGQAYSDGTQGGDL